IVVVDDGSGAAFEGRFLEVRGLPKGTVLGHAVNLGKGAALKTGFNHVLRELRDVSTIVTADAGGQHLVEDICRIGEAAATEPERLLLGVRQFGKDAPLRSRFGNSFTRVLFRILIGQHVSDTQTGLRGIPLRLAAQSLRVRSYGYEFELDMLVLAKHL